MNTQNNITRRIRKLSLVILTALLLSCSYSFAAEYPASNLKNDIAFETEIKIEKWMTSLSSWNSKTIALIETNVIEEEIEIEDWMLNTDYSNWNYEENESELIIESWMLDASDENWTNDSVEEEQEIESWMTNLEEWK
jgi:hypothetical protein